MKRINKEFFENGAEKVTEDDLQKVFENDQKILEKFQKKGHLYKFGEDAKLLLGAVKDYSTGRYRKFPYRVIAGIGFTLLYVLNPIDLIPDAIPVLGQLDDALVVALCVRLLEKELHEYKVWKMRNTKLLP